MSQIKKVLIVGGGTSGWLAAAYLSQKLGNLDITLIEASDIPTVGVGEATIPPIRNMVASLGIGEAEFLRKVSGTFKTAIRFDDWLYLPSGEKQKRHSYYHTFGPSGRAGQELLAPYWLMYGQKSGQSFVDYTMMEGRLCDANKGPKRIQDKDFFGPLSYAYHFDAGKLAVLLKELSLTRGVRHLLATVEDVSLYEDGRISYVKTKEHGDLDADIFIDCTGFAAVLIEKSLKRTFDSFNDVLFCDRAVACQAPYKEKGGAVHPYTISTAQPHGWTWEIPLSARRGIGYVYSSKYTDKDSAEALLREYVGGDTGDLKVWHLPMRCGKRKQQWYKNCISVGLSGGFIEPLESTGIYLLDIALRWLVDFWPRMDGMEKAAQSFNQRMNACYEDTVDFIKLHYAISKRKDTPFWKDNRNPKTWTDSLASKLESWQYRVPGDFEFGTLPAVFGQTNFLQVLYGMEYPTDLSGQEGRFPLTDAIKRQVQQYENMASGGLQVLPNHQTLIQDIAAKNFGNT